MITIKKQIKDSSVDLQTPVATNPTAITRKTNSFYTISSPSTSSRYAVDFTIGVDLFGSCCVYQVVIYRTIKQLVEETEEVSNEGNPPLRVYILAIMIPCILICMITTLKYLAPFSIVADIFLGEFLVATEV